MADCLALVRARSAFGNAFGVAVRDLVTRGHRRLVVAPVGSFARRHTAVFERYERFIAGFADDGAEGDAWFAGKPVVPIASIGDLKPDAVVLATDTHEAAIQALVAPDLSRGVTIVRLHTSRVIPSDGCRVLIMPPGEGEESIAVLAQRVAFMLAPVAHTLASVTLLVANTGDRQRAEVLKVLGRLGVSVDMIDCAESAGAHLALAASATADLVLDPDTRRGLGETRVSGADAGLKPPARVLSIDETSDRAAPENALLVHELLDPGEECDRTLAEARFITFIEEVRAARPLVDRAVCFGTGPLLEQAMSVSFGSSLCIACNSMVRNTPLLDRIGPVAFVAADPIFHAGPSAYAAAFRADLAAAMARFPLARLFVPWHHRRTYEHHLPQHLLDRLIPVPIRRVIWPTHTATEPVCDLSDRFEVLATGNVLTHLSLPIAASLSKRIAFVGCDGRPMQENSYFWSHHAGSQMHDLMGSARASHPAFFTVDYDAYYEEHCRTLGAMLDHLEDGGFEITSLTPSHIPALEGRIAEGRAA